MKIPKNKAIENSLLIAEQAESLSARALSTTEARTIGAEENPLREAAKALEGDYVKPILKRKEVRPGTIADPSPINELFSQTKQDLDTLLRTNRAISSTIENIYNTVAVKEDDIVGKLKTVRDKIASLKLYATEITDDDEYIVFTFTDGSKIKVPESTNIASYDEGEGALMLPVSSVESVSIKNISIMEGSTGSPGNNFERTRQRNGSVDAIKDGEPYTWFEYERLSDRGGEELKLILRLELAEPTVINRIKINPANLGTSNWVDIKDIEVQVDQRFVSIKSDIESPEWADEDAFKLAPSTSKYAGQGIFTFKPRLASAVQIVLTQNEAYPILNGRFLRYAIALRDIEISKVSFSNEGEFLLDGGSFKNPVRAIGIMQNLNPGSSTLAQTEFFISTDGGETWKDIVGLENKDAAKTEALILDQPSKRLMIKGKISRLSEGFSRPIDQGENIFVDKGKVSPASSISGSIALEATPETYLEVIETRYGCQGNYGNKYFLGKANGQLGSVQTLELPIQFDRDDISLLINNEEWIRTNGFTSENDKNFIYDNNGDNKTIILGDGLLINEGGMGGAVPTHNSEIYLKIRQLENPNVEELSESYKILLKYQASKVKESTKVILRDLSIQSGTSTSGPGSIYIDIPWERTDIELTGLETASYDYIESATEVEFQNGEVEFSNLNAGTYYSVDTTGNRIWLSSATADDSGDITATYNYTLRKIIPETSWKFSNSTNSIEVNKNSVSEKVGEKTIDARLNTRIIDIDGINLQSKLFSIVKNSIKGIDLNGEIGISRTLQTEIDFINGSTEFERIRTPGSSLLGFFSVDYEKNKIYLPRFDNIDNADRGFLPGKIVFKYISFDIHYNLGRKLSETRDYFLNGRTIELTPFYLDRIQEQTRRLQRQVDLHIRYNIQSSSQVQGTTLEPYYSPVLRDLAVIGIGIDARLGTLESL